MNHSTITATIAPQSRIAWVDTLRVLACFMVVFSHCCDGFVAQFDADRASFLTGTMLGSLMRPCVPLFAMMTGVLLLPLPAGATLGSFYRRRVGRIIPPLVFWSLALPPLAYLYFTGFGSHSVNPSVDLAAYTPEGLTNRLWTWVLNFNFDTTPLWYLYMLLGLYLIMPIVSAWLQSASRRDILTFLKVWAVTLILPYVKLFAPAAGYLGNYGNMDILGGCDWNVFSTFYYVSGFIGYIVLAYYLKRFPIRWSTQRLCATMIPLFVLGYAITAGGYVWLQERYPGDYAYLEIIWYFCGINVFMMTLPIFVAVQHFGSRPKPQGGNSVASYPLKRLASLTFGIYLCHFIFVMIAYDIFDIAGLPYIVRIVAMAVTAFTAAALLTWLLRRFRLTAPLVS